MKRPEAVRVFDASEKERNGKKQPIIPAEEPEHTSKRAGAHLISQEEFELDERKLEAQNKKDAELVALRAKMFTDDFGSKLIDFKQPGSAPEESFEDNKEMGRIDEIFGLIEQSGLNHVKVDQLFDALENLITAISRSDVDEQKINQIIGVIQASELEDGRKKELIGELGILYDATIMEIDDSEK